MTFFSALMLGLLASAHCAGMCGGLQSALQQPMVLRSKGDANNHLLAMNVGRLCIYVIAGIVFGFAGTSILSVSDIPQLSQFTRIAAATMLILIGVQLWFSRAKPFVQLEKLGVTLWGAVNKQLPHTYNNKLRSSFYRGLIWGFLPCGLVYGALVTTVFSNNGLQGAMTMLGFGLGTLPAMLLTGTLYQYLRRAVRNRGVQLVGASLFLQGGVLMLLAPYFTSTDFMRAYPELLSWLFCLS